MVWGLYWGSIIICSTVFEPELSRIPELLHLDKEKKGYQRMQMIRTFFLFVGSRLLTLPANLQITWCIFRKIVKKIAPWELLDGTLYTLGLERPEFIFVVMALLALLYISRQEEMGVSFRKKIAEFPIWCRWSVYYGALIIVIIFGVYGAGYSAGAFVYMNY